MNTTNAATASRLAPFRLLILAQLRWPRTRVISPTTNAASPRNMRNPPKAAKALLLSTPERLPWTTRTNLDHRTRRAIGAGGRNARCCAHSAQVGTHPHWHPVRPTGDRSGSGEVGARSARFSPQALCN